MLSDDATHGSPSQLTSPDLIPEADLNVTVVNERVVIRDDPRAGWRVVTVSGVALASYSRKDKVSQRYACVVLHRLGFADQAEIIAAFGHGRASQGRWESLYRQRGLKGLVLEEPPGRRSLVKADVEAAVEKLHEDGLGLRRISTRLGLSVNQVVRIYRLRGIKPHTGGEQEGLFAEAPGEAGEADQGEAAAADVMRDGSEGEEAAADSGPWTDGLLVPQPESGEQVAWAGGLLAAPVLRRLRAVDVFAAVYEGFGPVAVYGLELFVTLMVLLALWRIKRPEQLKTVAPTEVGRALGLPRAPEVKTVRRKLRQLAKQELAREVMVELAKVRLEREEGLIGYLYIDGHVREYSGKEDLAKTYSTVRHMPVEATTDTWVADRHGDPVLLVTSEVNEHLSQALEPVLSEVRRLIGEERRATVIFDRGGWSPQLFARLVEEGFDIITYRKGRSTDVPPGEFVEVTLAPESKGVTYWLHDRPEVRVGGGEIAWKDGTTHPLVMREVTRLNRESGHQTKVLTTRHDLAAGEVLWRMFARWRQENYFKYMLEEMAVDGLVEYGSDPVDPELDRPNPEHRTLVKAIDKLKNEIRQLQGQRCELIGDPSRRFDAPPGFERFIPSQPKSGALLAEIRELKGQLGELEARKQETPERISAGDLRRLRTERQQLATIFKTVAYQVETDLLRLVAPHYARAEDEGRKLIAAALRSPARVEVTDSEVKVTLAPQSSPHRSRAIAGLCASLNKLGASYPGTNLRLVLDCKVQATADVS